MRWDESIIVCLLVLSIVSTILAVGRIPFIMNQATGQSKFGCGPHLARRPDFGHAWFKRIVLALVYRNSCIVFVCCTHSTTKMGNGIYIISCCPSSLFLLKYQQVLQWPKMAPQCIFQVTTPIHFLCLWIWPPFLPSQPRVPTPFTLFLPEITLKIILPPLFFGDKGLGGSEFLREQISVAILPSN